MRQILAVSVVGVLIVAGGLLWWRQQAPAQEAATYANPSTCGQCHTAIAATYKKTGMGRSFRKIREKEDIGSDVPARPFYHAASSSYFQMSYRDGAWFQRRWQTGFDGKETNVDEKRVDFIMGSGNHSRTFLHLTERGSVQELPYAWYSENGGLWGMNPGYDRGDYAGSIRPIYYECMFCHNGYPNIPQGDKRDVTQAAYEQPLPEGIDCQRCHGPGQMHVDRASTKAPVEEIRAAIVNPSKLSPQRSMEVCLQCHLETSNEKLPHAVVRLERTPFTFRPGQPLEDYIVAFDREAGKNTDFEVAQAAGYQFRKSQCFLKSSDKLSCTTCHNPHDIPRGAAASAKYNQVCTGCHESVKPSPAHKPNADCVTCHMPKQRTDDAVHVIMTNHYIAPRPPSGNLIAAKAEKTDVVSYQGEVIPYYPVKLASTPENDLTIAVAQVRERANLKVGIPQLAALIEKYQPKHPGYYAELGEAYLAVNDTAAAIRNFEQASKLEPTSGARLMQWGDALMEARQWAVAEEKLRRATELAPGDPRAWGRLGWTLWQRDKGTDAKTALEKAISLDPELPEVHNNLGQVLWGTGDRARAEAEFREALRIQPGVAEWRLNFARVLAAQSKFDEAAFHAEHAVKLKPSNAESHEVYGDLLARTGNLTKALAELQTAVRMQPAFPRAHLELGMVFAARGDLAGAREHLNVAAQSSDPQASAEARQQLQRIR